MVALVISIGLLSVTLALTRISDQLEKINETLREEKEEKNEN